jgi:hypothetical protein
MDIVADVSLGGLIYIAGMILILALLGWRPTVGVVVAVIVSPLVYRGIARTHATGLLGELNIALAEKRITPHDLV